MHKQHIWRKKINTGILIYVNGLQNLYRKQVDLGGKIGEKFTPLEILVNRFSNRKNFEIVLVMPSNMENTGLHENATQLGIKTFFFDQNSIKEKPLGLRQQRWAFEDDSGCEEWVGAAFQEPLGAVKWNEFILLPIENILVEPAAVVESLNLFYRQNFEICFSKERQSGANWVIFKTEVINALLANHQDIMWARGGLAWAVNKPLYPFEVGNFNCPRIRPSLAADLRLNSLRSREMISQTFDDTFASPDFSYENYLKKSNWEYFYSDYAPQTVYVEPSAICRAECFSCPKNKLERKSGLMPLQTFNKAYSQFDKSSEARFVFSGIGEPFLNPALSDMIGLASSSSSMLVTSLQKMPDSDFNFSDLDQIRISVDALEANSFEKKRPGCNWKNIEQFIAEFSALKAKEPEKFPELGVTMVRHGLNEKDSLAFLNYWKKVTTPPYRQWFFRWPFDLKPDKIQWYQILGENTFARQLAKTSAIDFTPVKRRPCKHALTSVSLLWNGDVSVCPFDFQGKMILGNVNEQSLMEIWQSDNARAIRRAHLSQNLSELPAICGGCTDWYHNL